MIKSISIKNFRGIEEIQNLQVDKFNIFIGDNGTSKTSMLDAINFSFSPNFLSGRIKHTDFWNGNDDPIEIDITLADNFSITLPDGYNEQFIDCNRISLGIKKRERKTAGKIFSDLVTLNHLVVPTDKPGPKGYSSKRTDGSEFHFTDRALSMSQVTINELSRSFFYGKERDRQLQKGYNSSFSTFLDDLNWRFSRSVRKETGANGEPAELLKNMKTLAGEIAGKTDFDKYEVFKELQNRTQKFGLEQINLSILDSIAPYESAFLSTSKGYLDLPIVCLGSGIEMIISLLFLETLASMSKEKLLILIDEPELHLHPKLQEQLADYLWRMSCSGDGHQIFVTTHSPIFFKNCMGKTGIKTFITRRETGTDKIIYDEFSLGGGLFPWSPSWGEINYKAYNFDTIEFHDELYGFIQEKAQCYKEKEMDDLLNRSYGILKDRDWIREQNGKAGNLMKVTLPVFIRNKIHHPENKTMQSHEFSKDELHESIGQLITVAKKII